MVVDLDVDVEVGEFEGSNAEGKIGECIKSDGELVGMAEGAIGTLIDATVGGMVGSLDGTNEYGTDGCCVVGLRLVGAFDGD